MSADPVLIAFTVRRNPKSGRKIWTKVGHVYPHDKGSGLTLVLEVLPIPAKFDGRIVMLEPNERDFKRIDDERFGPKSDAHAKKAVN